MNRQKGKTIQLVAIVVATLSVTALALGLWMGMTIWLIEVFAVLAIVGLWVNAIVAVLAYLAQKKEEKAQKERKMECTQSRN